MLSDMSKAFQKLGSKTGYSIGHLTTYLHISENFDPVRNKFQISKQSKSIKTDFFELFFYLDADTQL